MQTVSEVMTRGVRFLSPQEDLQHAAQMMGELDVGALPVCDGNRLVGMITDRDITIRATAARFRAVGYFYEPDHKASYERNEPRTGKRRVSPAGLFGVLKHLERPDFDEGFDASFLARAKGDMFTLVPWQA